MVKRLNFDFGQVAYHSKGNLTLAKHDTIGKGSSSGAEWCKFQLHCIFHFGVNRPQIMSSISAKTHDYYSARFSAKTKILILVKNDTKRALQGEQNSAYFNFIASSTLE